MMLRLIFEVILTIAWIFILYCVIIGAFVPSYPMFIVLIAIVVASNIKDTIEAYKAMKTKQQKDKLNAFIKSVHLPIDRRHGERADSTRS